MKILVACVDLIAQNINRQPWYYINSIIQSLSDNGHEVWKLTNKQNANPKTIIIENFRSFPDGISLETIKTIQKKKFDVLFWPIGLTDFFFKKKIDVFDIPVIGVVTSPRYHLKELLSLGHELFYNKDLISQFILGTLLTKQRVKKLFYLQNLKAIIFECKGTKDRFVKDAEIDRKSFIINPPLPKYYIELLNNMNIKNNNITKKEKEFKVMYLGPPLFLRGVDTLIKSFRIFHEEVKKSKLIMLFRIESEAMIKHEKRVRKLLEREKIKGFIEIVSGMLAQTELVKYVLSSNVVCLPFKLTISDVPIVTLEIIASGIPLITTDVAGVGEFCTSENCFVVPKDNPKIIAKKLIYIYKNNIVGRDYFHEQPNNLMSDKLEEILIRARL